MNKKAEEKVSNTKSENNSGFAFSKPNYIIMLIGIAVIAVGFTLMYGKEDIFSFEKITLAPLIVLSGFVIEVFAILYKPKTK